jgi:DNA-directed RNA polymerase specialized sigma24 family protein
MADEARSMWEAFITDPENAHLFQRYAKSAKEPAPLFDSIGEDLGSSKQEVREQAYWALVAAMPELTDILHERQTRRPGWRDIKGKDQQMVNQGMDILSHLHRKFVVERYFKIHGRYGKDPRPYVKKAIHNREIDEQRKTERERPSDDEWELETPSPTPSIEDRVLENNAFETRKRELLAWGFLSQDELNLLETVCVDASPLDEIREELGIRSQDALRQSLSRARKNIVAERDALFTYLLVTGREFPERGKVPQGFDDLEKHREWVERAKRSVQPGVWLDGVAADGKNAMAVRPLTRGFRSARAHIYLIAIHKDYLSDFSALCSRPGCMRPSGEIPMKVLMIKGFLATRSHASKPCLSIRELAGTRFTSMPVIPGGTGRRNRCQNFFSFTYFHGTSAARPLG